MHSGLGATGTMPKRGKGIQNLSTFQTRWPLSGLGVVRSGTMS